MSRDWVDMSDCGRTGLHPELNVGLLSESERHAGSSGSRGSSVVCVFL
jgi:hypothetical protein